MSDRGTDWWEQLGTTALLGTARRPVPATPVLPVLPRDVAPEVALLDAVAVGSALRRAGAVPAPVGGPDRPPAPPDRLPLAPARARQLLDLLLTQSPVGARLARPAILVWLHEAARREVRVHHATLVPLLTAATTHQELRVPVLAVLDSRGQWLAAAHPEWHWAVAGTSSAAPGEGDEVGWAHLPTDARAARLRTLRGSDPALARSLVESTWDRDPVAARVQLLAELETGLSLDDEALLERALDDRSARVREVAVRLLDALPGSARAARLAEVLTPLLSTTGLVRRRVQVELPSTPGPGAVRDGLGKAPHGRSERGLWLERLAAAAPFETWTAATGMAPAALVATLDAPDALAGLARAAVARGNAEWARALLDRHWDPALVQCLPAEERGARMLRRLREVSTGAELVSVLELAPGPWSEQVSARVAAELVRLERVPHLLTEVVPVLAERLHPGVAPRIQRLAADVGPGGPLHQLAQFLTLVPTIKESFR